MPAAEPGDVQRPPGFSVRGRQADLHQADQHLLAGAAGPRALHPVCALHPVLRPDRRRPVHRDAGARRAAAGRHLCRGAVRVVLLRQHRADLPGRRADRHRLPFPRPPLRPGLQPQRVRALRVGMRAAHRPPPRQGAAPAGRRRARGQRRVELRQGPVGVHLRHPGRPDHHSAGPRCRRRTGARVVAARGRRGARRAHHRGRWRRRAAGWPIDRRRCLRVLQVRTNCVGHQ